MSDQANDALRRRRRRLLRQDLAVVRYLDAAEAGDWAALAALWEQAANDPDLAQALEELSDGLAAEMEPSPGWRADAAKVAALLKAHLPSSDAPPAPPSGPLTAGDVAARIAGDPALLARLGPEERRANAALLPDPTPLPSELGVSLLDQWAAALPVRASPAYWRVFRHVAVLLAMSRAQSPGQAGMTLAAARTSQPPQPARGSDQPGPRP